MNRREHGSPSKSATWPAYRVAAARASDLPRLAAIELAAARLLAGHAPDHVLEETTSLQELQTALRCGQLWVGLTDDVPVGFAQVEMLEPGAAHLKEVDVHPAHGRRGVGSRLVLTVCAWAAAHGCESVTLTTFRDLPWNMPFYAKLGFEIVRAADMSPALHAIVADEARRGLDPARRVVMRRRTARRDGGIVCRSSLP